MWISALFLLGLYLVPVLVSLCLPDPRGGGKGDLYYHVRVLTPSKLTREQRKLMEQLGATLKVENKPAERGSSFFDKVKDIFG